MRQFLILTTLVVGLTMAQQYTRYDNYTLYRLTAYDNEALKMLQYLQSKPLFASNFWSQVRSVGAPIDVMVPPRYKHDFDKLMNYYTIHSEVMMENIQEHIDNQKVRKQPCFKTANGMLDWENYHTLDEIYAWLDQLAEDYPSQVTIFEAGKTYENRVIKGVKISFSKANENRAAFIESNIHAREWISGAVATFIMNEILTSKDEKFRTTVESFDWYFTPITNPDGFVYTHNGDRLWRKTMKPYGRSIFGECRGADPNRNFDFQWDTAGAEDNPCSEVYAGPKAQSEIEVKTLSETLSKLASKIKLYISFHSYSQLLMVPYGHTARHLDNYNVTVPLARKAAAALSQRYGTTYTVGDIAETVYPASGSSVDWIKGVHRTPYSFAYELRDKGRYGFLLPTDQIIPTALETLDSVLVFLEAILQEY